MEAESKARKAVDYGGVRNILRALGTKKPRIAPMTAIGVTNREGSYNRSTEAHDWKRRAERLAATRGESGCRALYGNAVLRELADPATAASGAHPRIADKTINLDKGQGARRG
jgi:hypothetical protein